MNKFIDKMERKLGRFAIKNLMFYIIALQLAGYFLVSFRPELKWYMELNAAAILQGQVWRIITFQMLPRFGGNILLLVIQVYFYYLVGSTLERYWGSFRINLYYFTAIIGLIITALVSYFVTGNIYILSASYIPLTMIICFAFIVPDATVYLMFILPLKMKWLAYLEIFFILSDFYNSNITGRITIVVTMVNFCLYFYLFMRQHVKSPRDIQRRRTYQKSASQGAKKKVTRHKCAVCGRTEEDGEDLEFRFCSKCNGNYEYCQDHLFTHTHKE